MKSNFIKILNKYLLLKNSFLKDLRLRKQKVKSIWSKTNALKNNDIKKIKNIVINNDLSIFNYVEKRIIHCINANRELGRYYSKGN